MGVFQRGARPAVCGDTHPQNDFLQFRLTHLHLHRQGLWVHRVRRGVYKHVSRVKIAAGRNTLLRIDQLLLVVDGTAGQAGQTRHQHRVVTLNTSHLDVA